MAVPPLPSSFPPSSGPPPPGPALAQTPLLSFLVHSPNPSLVLPLAPLLDALKSRQALSPLRTPLWSGGTITPGFGFHATGLAPGRTSATPAPLGHDADPAALLGSIEQLNVKTPLGVVGGETPASGGGDYFSIVAGSGSGSSNAREGKEEEKRPSPVPSSAASSTSSTSSATTLGVPSGRTSSTPATPADDALQSPAADSDEDPFERMLRALQPVYRNEAWRSLESGTRRNSAAPARGSSATAVGAGYAQNAARRRSAGSAGGSTAAGAKRRTDDEDVLMGGLPRTDSFGTGSGGTSRGGSPLGTVEEEQELYEMDTDDGESGLGSLADEEPWQSAYQFLTPEEQGTLLTFVLDCLEDSDVVAAYLPRMSPPSVAAAVGIAGTASGGAPYHSPRSISPTSTVPPPLSPPSATNTSSSSSSSGGGRWAPSPAFSSSTSGNVTASGFTAPQSLFSASDSYLASSSSSSSHRASFSSSSSSSHHQRHSHSPSPAHSAPSAPNVALIDSHLISATIVPVPPGAHPPTGFVILTAPPPPPPPAAPVQQQGWLPNRFPVRSSSSRSGSTSVGKEKGGSSSGPAAGVTAADTALTPYRSPAAGEASATLPTLRSGSDGGDEAMDPWFRALGTGEMARRIAEFDWGKTPLGPISSWAPELKTMVASILASPFRECILFGDSMTIVYNDLYIETAGDKHPNLLGLPAREGWAEIWDGLNSIAKRTLAGETCFFKEHYLAMERRGAGFVEETYHTFSYAPFYDEQGAVIGIRNLSIENSATVIAARRLATVRDLVQMTSLARSVEDFSETALRSLANNPYDIPFALLYTVDEVSQAPTKKEVRLGYDRSTRTSIKLTCRGSTGIPADHPFLIQEALVDITPPMSRQSSSSASTSTGTGSTATAMDLRERLLSNDAGGFSSPGALASTGSPAPSTASSASTAGTHRFGGGAGPRVPQWTWPFEEACMKRDPVLVDDLGALAESLDRSKGWAIPTRQAVVIPVMVDAGQSIPSAVLVLGVNAMSRYDHLMDTFFGLLARHTAIGFFSVLATEQDRQRADELVKLDRAKSNFFSSVSHELRTPLTLILGPLDDLLSGPEKDKLNKAQREKLVLVNRHANRLLAMVNKLLDFSSIENGKFNFKHRPVQIGPLTRDIATLFRDAIERAGIEYVVDCDVDPPDCLPVYLAPDILEKIVFNLVGNALKYSKEGKIAVTLRSTRGEAVLSVSDTGIGIPQNELGRIFDRFHRTEHSRTAATGTGIGLALTLELVKLLGGQLEVESEVGRGSTFLVRLQRGHTHLPIEQVDHTPEEANPQYQSYQSRNLAVVDEAASWRYDAAIEEAIENTPLSSASSSSGTASEQGNSSGSGSGSGEDYLGNADILSLKNRTIVLVDDSRDLRTYMASLLARQFTVVQFGDPREALEYINKQPPSLVITDQMMPFLTGMELTAALRRNPATALTPIVMVSAQAGSEARAEALEGGLDDYLVKPFQARELLARVRVHLQLGLMRVELEKRVDERTRALIESEARNRSLAERYSMLSTVSPVGVVEISSTGKILYVNPRWSEITGVPLHRPFEEWREMVVPEDWEKVERLWKMATEEGRAGETDERQFRFKNGRWAQLEIRSSADVGLPDGYVGALTDITKQKEAELLHIKAVEQRAADAEQTRINTEMFLDMSSHELRNPLSGVWQNAEVVASSLDKYVDLLDDLRNGHAPPEEELQALFDEMQENIEAVDSILLCAAHQGRIADDILSVSKLNMGLLTVNPVPFEIVPRMSEVLRVFEVECSQKSITLKLNADPSIDRLNANWVCADPSRLHQILLNFLTNSIKYSQDAPTRRIVVHIQAHESQPPLRAHALRVSQPPPIQLEDPVWIVIAVEDTGRGLSDEELKRLFARFSQANPRSDQYGGSGLGLYVSKKLIELHNGFIEVESRLGVGSIFSFSIPAERASPPSSPVNLPTGTAMSMAPTARLKRPSTATETSKTAPLASPTTIKRPLASPTMESTKAMKSGRMSVSPTSERKGPTRVLVVEDNLINQKVLLRQLKNAGFEVTVANNGQEALDEVAKDQDAARAKPDEYNPLSVVLCDIEMPVMGGLEFAQRVREGEREGKIDRRYPLCAVTGNAREEQQQQCRAAGFDDVATKPYKIDDVLFKIRALAGLEQD
ncbi:hypothetical protein JCM6882_004493 [Rhodosporidiobolus microsporus]